MRKHVLQQQFNEPSLGGSGGSNRKGNGSSGHGPSDRPKDPPKADDGLERIANWSWSTASGGTSSEGVAEALVTLETIVKSAVNPPYELKLMPVETSRLLISSIVMYATYGGMMYYVVYMIEATSKPMGTQDIGTGRERVPTRIPITVDVFYNQDMINDIEGLLIQKTGLTPVGQDNNGDPIYPIFGVGKIVIRRGVELKLREKMAPYFDSGVFGIQSALLLNHRESTTSRSVADLVEDNKELTTTYAITPGHTFPDLFGYPTAADFTVVQSLATAKRKSSRNVDWQENIHGRGTDAIASITAYLDMRSTNSDETRNIGRNTRLTPGYDPVVVITSNNILGLDGQSYNTLLSTLLGLTLVVPIMDPAHKRWAALFDPGFSESQKLPPLGLLGLEYDPTLPAKHVPEIVTIGPSTLSGGATGDAPTVQEFVRGYFTDNVVVAVDNLRGGATGFFMDLIGDASPGSAYESIIVGELDDFTEGNFSRLWDKRDEPIVLARTAIWAGHYADENSQVRDGRTINYLRMLDQTEGDQNVFDGFARGLEPDTDTLLDMAEKYSILVAAARDLTITGVYDRYFINTNFITDILRALEICGVVSTVEGLRDLENNSSRRDRNAKYFGPMESSGVYRNGRYQASSSSRYRTTGERGVFKGRR